MEDLEIDLGAIYYGIRNVDLLISDLSSLSSALAGASFSDPEIPSSGKLAAAKAQIDNYKTVAEDILRKLNNTKNILINNDREAAMFFQFLETGVLDENFNFTEVPLYDQQMYTDVRYNRGNVAGNGCGLTSMAMIISYLYNDIITPEELAPEADKAQGLVYKMERAGQSQGLAFTCEPGGYGEDKMRETLADGKFVIISVNGGGHFVLCTGVTDDGKFLVNDPYGPWQKDVPLKWSEINKSCGYVWVIDPYENIGNAHTNIGNVSVSPDVQRAILEANSGSENVDITNATYLRNIERQTAAQVAGEGAHIGPTALSLREGGDQAVSLRYSRDGSDPLSPRAQALAQNGDSRTPGNVPSTTLGAEVPGNTPATPLMNTNGNTPAAAPVANTNGGTPVATPLRGNNDGSPSANPLGNNNSGDTSHLTALGDGEINASVTNAPTGDTMANVESPIQTGYREEISSPNLIRTVEGPIIRESIPSIQNPDIVRTVEAPLSTGEVHEAISGVPIQANTISNGVGETMTSANPIPNVEYGSDSGYTLNTTTSVMTSETSYGGDNVMSPSTPVVDTTTYDAAPTVDTVTYDTTPMVDTNDSTPHVLGAYEEAKVDNTISNSNISNTQDSSFEYEKIPSTSVDDTPKKDLTIPIAASLGGLAAVGIGYVSQIDEDNEEEEKKKRN